MAVMFNSLVFGGVNSADYGIYITGEAVYNAPERAVELVSVPGRNGQVAIDQGRWENVEVTYPAGCFGDSQADFAQKISAFRNAIASKIGYQRLTDTYNSDEYRMAMYTAGLEVNAENKWNGTAGEFNITFNCKPQRWLTSGETPVVVTSGDELTNPTLYESSPLLEVSGYGHIQMGEDSVTIESLLVGDVLLINSGVINRGGLNYDASNLNLMEDGDNIVVQAGSVIAAGLSINSIYGTDKVTSMTITIPSSSEIACHIADYSSDGRRILARLIIDEDIVVPKGSQVRKTITSASVSATYMMSGATKTWNGTLTYEVCFWTWGISIDHSTEGTLSSDLILYAPNGTSQIANVIGQSTKSIIGENPVFIDCDLGEAYTIIDGEISSLNAYIDLGSDLPTLGTGANEITYDNTITGLKISPRWWQL